MDELIAESFDVIIVGAGAAGIGCGVALADLGLERFVILDRTAIGASFAAWPQEMRFITPSFPSNAFGPLDLNAVARQTSPAFTLGQEHPSGPAYARYLRGVAGFWALPVRTGVEVQAVRAGDDGFTLTTSAGVLHSRYVIWAAGEFGAPRRTGFPGASLCRHSSTVRRWAQVRGDEVTVIGGYESGIDAAVGLCAAGKRVRVLAADARWESTSSEPSLALAPYTVERLAAARATGRVELIGDTRITRVQRCAAGYRLLAASGASWTSPTRPILATGFTHSLAAVTDYFAYGADGAALLTEEDESTTTPGLFLSGPLVRHSNLIFCFIYKFRQRFGVLGQALAWRLQLDPMPLALYRQSGLLLDDLSCCGEECVCG